MKMKKGKKVIKKLINIGVIFAYVMMIVVLIIQALTPGSQSSNISNSVGNKIDQIVTGISKPTATTVAVEKVEILSLTLSGNEVTTFPVEMTKGETAQLNTKVSPNNATNPALTYSSSNEEVLKIHADGRIEALAAGEATITATAVENAQKTASVQILISNLVIPLESIEITNIPADLKVGQTHRLEINYAPMNTTQKAVSWESSNTSVLTVDDLGNIKGIAEGVATISVTAVENAHKTASVQITVSIIAIEGIKISNPVSELKVGKTHLLQTEFTPANTTQKGVSWKSSNTSVLTVDKSGKIKGIADGVATVTVTSTVNSQISASIQVEVKSVPLQSIQITNIPSEFRVGQAHRLEVKLTPSGTTQKSVSWKSSDTSVLTVDKSGNIKGIAQGTTTVTVTSTANKNISASVTITVLPEIQQPVYPVESMSINKPQSTVFKIGERLTLSTVVLPAEATDTIVWDSSNDDIATVSQSGLVKFISAGSVTITARCGNYSFEDSITFTVKEVLSSTITIQTENLTQTSDGYILGKGSIGKIKGVLDSNATILDIDYSSSDSSIASISEDGVIEAFKEGRVTITASSSYDGETVSQSITVIVKEILSSSITIQTENLTQEGEDYTIIKGNYGKIKGILDENATILEIVYSSSDSSIASISEDGVIEALKGGTVTITATSSYDGETVSQSITITVKEIVSASIRLELKNLTKSGDGFVLKEGKSGKIKSVLEENATILDVVYTSSDSSIASVSADGVIQALKGGTVTITASTSYGDEITSASFTLTVDPITFKDNVKNFYRWVRKGFGHFGAFLVLGIFASWSYCILFSKNTKGRIFSFLVTLIAGFAIAGITEILQLPIFTAGRYCSFDDVMLDFRGYCTSSLAIFALVFAVHFIKLFIAKRKQKQSNEVE